MTGLEAIRTLSAIFERQESVDRLALINLIVRGMTGDAEQDFVKETVLKTANIELEL